MFLQGEGALTHAGRRHSPTVYGHHHTAKESLDINLLKADRNSAVPLPNHGLLQCGNDTTQELVTYKYCTSHFILPWLPQKLAERIGDNMCSELQIPCMTSAK